MSAEQERTELREALPVMLTGNYKAGDTFERNTSDGRTWSIEVKWCYNYYHFGVVARSGDVEHELGESEIR